MDKNSMAKITQVESYDEANELTHKGNIVLSYMTDKGTANLFEDGSMLEPVDEYGAGTIIREPKKQVEIALNEVYEGFNSDEDGFVLTIKDQRGSDIIKSPNNTKIRLLSISEDGSGFLYETDDADESMARNITEEQVNEHLAELGYDESDIKVLKNVVEQKNDELRNRSVVDFLKEKFGIGEKQKKRHTKKRKMF